MTTDNLERRKYERARTMLVAWIMSDEPMPTTCFAVCRAMAKAIVKSTPVPTLSKDMLQALDDFVAAADDAILKAAGEKEDET